MQICITPGPPSTSTRLYARLRLPSATEARFDSGILTAQLFHASMLVAPCTWFSSRDGLWWALRLSFWLLRWCFHARALRAHTALARCDGPVAAW